MLLIAASSTGRFSGSTRGDMDLIFVAIIVLFFAVSGWLISALEKL
jgi:hypothetical protein